MARQTKISSFFRPFVPSAASAAQPTSPLLPTPFMSGLSPAAQDVRSTSSDDEEMAFILNTPPHVPSSSDDEEYVFFWILLRLQLISSGDTPYRAVQVDSLSSVGSVIPQDLASQVGQVLPLEGQLATVFVHGSPLQSMLSDMIAPQVNSYLNNLAKLPASLLSQAECLASSRPTSPKPAAPSRVQEALLAKGAWGGSLGHTPSSVCPGPTQQQFSKPHFHPLTLPTILDIRL
ncbi:hypothetical protein E2C01_031561 [Portunus trituberculatus]|uniref:Uncharacterized protein n=1 Tax=Portunus trituberculatus TaxID=210409 RepID=A0A5B7ET38_PORTR|nr:hypothetical protein [Portunus trituberculatus]